MDDEVLHKVPYNKRWGLMPEHYFPHDAPSISARLRMVEALGPNMRKLVCDAYAKAYREAWEAEPLGHRKDGKARFAANTRLRVFVERKFTVFKR